MKILLFTLLMMASTVMAEVTIPPADKIVIHADGLPMCKDLRVMHRIFTLHRDEGEQAGADLFGEAVARDMCRLYTGPLVIHKIYDVGRLSLGGVMMQVALFSMRVTDNVELYLMMTVPEQA